MAMTRSVRFFLILGIGLLLLDGALFLIARPPRSAHPAATVVSSGTAAIGGAFAILTTDGKAVTDQTYRGTWMLIYFGYTFCPDACPTTLTNMSIALQTLREEADPIQPLFITVDPKRDTAAVLGEYLKSFDPRIEGLTGSQQQTEAIVKTYRVFAEPQKAQSDGSYLVDHSPYVYLIDPLGKFVDVIEGATPPAEMAEWLRKSMRDRVTCKETNTCAT
jgi:protein SCO1/2